MLNIRKIIILGLLLRIAAVVATIDLNEMETWEYGAIAENLANGKGYSLFYHRSGELEYKYSSIAQPYISAYMPPGYVYLIMPIYKFVESQYLRNIIMLGLNMLFDCMTMLILYRYAKEAISEKVGIFSTLLFAVFPQFIILNTKIGTGSLFVFLAVLLFYLMLKRNQFQYYSFAIGLVLSVMAYMRSEALLLGLIIITWIVLQKRYKEALTIAVVLLISIIPWQLRNYNAFVTPISLTTSSGLNLYRGNNPYYPGFWSDAKIDIMMSGLDRNNNFEISLDKMYKSEAIEYMKENTTAAFANIPMKMINLWGVDWHDSRSHSSIYLLSHFILLLLFIAGLVLSKGKFRDKKILIIYLAYFTVNCGIFFALPRYQVMMEIACVPFAAIALNNGLEAIKKRKS